MLSFLLTSTQGWAVQHQEKAEPNENIPTNGKKSFEKCIQASSGFAGLSCLCR
jgi:hypothetical protein